MELKPGYKQTEIGVIPEDWKVRRLGELIDSSRHIRYGIVQPGHYEPSGSLMLRSQDYSKGWRNEVTMHRVSGSLSAQYRNASLAEGDLVMTVVGAGIGQVVISPAWLDGAILSRSTARIAVRSDVAAKEFIKAVLEGPIGDRQIMDCQKEGAQPVVSCADLARFLLPAPPFAEQEAIAGALSDADALIDSLEQLIAKKRLLKQGAMQDLLTGKKRLPGFEGEWEVKKLGAIGSFQKGSGVKKDEANSGDLACVRYGEIYTRHDDWVRTFYSRISPEVAATARRLTKGDLLFAGSGETREEIGKCVAFLFEEEAYAGGDIVILRPVGVDSLFMGYYLNTPVINTQKASKGQGDAVVHISANALADLDVKIPTRSEQSAIAAILSDMDAEIAALEAKLAKARQVKQGMMQELLTGKTRLI